jgi:hypothetical protein
MYSPRKKPSEVRLTSSAIASRRTQRSLHTARTPARRSAAIDCFGGGGAGGTVGRIPARNSADHR